MERATPEIAVLVERLRSFSLPDGGVPYYRGNASAAEPTLLAALALFVSGTQGELAEPLWPGLRSYRTLTGLSASTPDTAIRAFG